MNTGGSWCTLTVFRWAAFERGWLSCEHQDHCKKLFLKKPAERWEKPEEHRVAELLQAWGTHLLFCCKQEGCMCMDSQFLPSAEVCSSRAPIWLGGYSFSNVLMASSSFKICWGGFLFDAEKQPPGKRAIGNGRKTVQIWKFGKQTTEELGKCPDWEGKSSSSQYASRIKLLFGYYTQATSLIAGGSCGPYSDSTKAQPAFWCGLPASLPVKEVRDTPP